MEHARARGETAIGYLSADGPLHLAPGALERHTYQDGDRIIVVRRNQEDLSSWLSEMTSHSLRLGPGPIGSGMLGDTLHCGAALGQCVALSDASPAWEETGWPGCKAQPQRLAEPS